MCTMLKVFVTYVTIVLYATYVTVRRIYWSRKMAWVNDENQIKKKKGEELIPVPPPINTELKTVGIVMLALVVLMWLWPLLQLVWLWFFPHKRNSNQTARVSHQQVVRPPVTYVEKVKEPPRVQYGTLSWRKADGYPGLKPEIKTLSMGVEINRNDSEVMELTTVHLSGGEGHLLWNKREEYGKWSQENHPENHGWWYLRPSGSRFVGKMSDSNGNFSQLELEPNTG